MAGAAAPAAAVFTSAPAHEGEAAASFAALHGLYWLTLNLAAETPLVLAVDDVHWCDRPSLRFLAYLAAALFLSEKTVEHHLSRLYAKFGVRSRAELIAVFAREAVGAAA
jgi:hypothetical protein